MYFIHKPVVTYARETWSTTKEDNGKLAVWERKVLRNILGPVYNSYLRVFEKRGSSHV